MFEEPERVSGACVQNEHSGPPSDKATAAAPISGYRILRALVTLGWAERELARRTGRHQTTVRRWIEGLSPVDPAVAAWLETLEHFHLEHPAPRLAPRMRSTVAEREHDQHGEQRAGNTERAQTASA